MGETIVRTAGWLLWGLIRNHDAFAKWVLDQPGVPEALFEYIFPPELRALWDGSAVVALSGSLITQEFREQRSDRGYLCPPAASAAAPLLVVLEHKARPDRDVGWQLTQYLYEHVRAWINARKDLPQRDRRLRPMAVAVVLYHGRRRWRFPLTLTGPLSDGKFSRHIPNFEFLLFDVLRTPIERLPPLPRLRMAFLIWQFDYAFPGVRPVRKSASLKGRLTDLARRALALGLDDLIAMVYYLAGELDQNGVALLREVLDELLPGRKEEIMQTIGDQLVAEGRAKGLIEGEARGRAKGLIDGEAKGRREMLHRLLRRRFGRVRADIDERIRTANIEQLDDWSERILDAETVEEIFGVDRRH